jgi:hypothetical protein
MYQHSHTEMKLVSEEHRPFRAQYICKFHLLQQSITAFYIFLILTANKYHFLICH